MVSPLNTAGHAPIQQRIHIQRFGSLNYHEFSLPQRPEKNRQQKRQFMEGNKERRNKKGDWKDTTVPNIFPLGLQKPGSFWKLKKMAALMDTDTKQMSHTNYCTNANVLLGYSYKIFHSVI